MSVATQFSHDYSASTIYHQNVVLVDGQGFSFHRRPHHHHRQRLSGAESAICCAVAALERCISSARSNRCG